MEELLTFGEAVEKMLEGQRMTRLGWNGKDQWVCFMPPVTIPPEMVNQRTRKFVPSGELNVGGYFVMWTAHKIWQPGWLASQADMISHDWKVVP